MKVLAVDDDALVLKVMRAMVTSLGHECLQARDGQEAWQIIQAERPNMVITDRLMPDMDGLDLCRMIRKASTGHDYVYVLLASALGQEEQAREGMLAGADDYLIKPLNRAQLELKLIAAERVARLHRHLAQLNDKLGQSENRLSLLNDELEQRVRERTAELEESTNELSAFAYSVSHDLRAPLRSLHGYSQILLDEYATCLDDVALSYLGRLQANATRMGQIIDDLLGLSRTTRAELRRQEIDLGPLIETIHQELQDQQPDRDVRLSLEGSLSTSADSRLLRLALENLLSNARKFTANESLPHISVGCVLREGERVFFIRDNGAGFDPRFAKKLFEPFQRLHSAGEFEGNGIGLAIVHRVIRRHGGRIWAESAPDHGATFYFTTARSTGHQDTEDHDVERRDSVGG